MYFIRLSLVVRYPAGIQFNGWYQGQCSMRGGLCQSILMRLDRGFDFDGRLRNDGFNI
jgi:hypothetical protein